MQMHEVRYEDLRAAPLPNLMSLLSFLLPTESLPPLEDLACVVELNEEAEAYHSRKSGAFSAWERFSVRISPDGLDHVDALGQPDMRALILQMTARQWCRYGYGTLLKNTLGQTPIDCTALAM
jgi:hypothetical protein